jgi:ABC-2 type transport system permease protein
VNPARHAVRLGVRRGWTEFVQSVRSSQDQGFWVFMGVASLVYLWFARNNEVEGTSLSYPTVAMPSLLGALLAFGVVIGPAYALAMEREDGTLLRHKAIPHGIQGYVTGQLVLHSLGLLPLLTVLLLPSFLLFDDLMSNGLTGWLTVLWVLVLGLLAMLPLGMILGAVVPGTQKVGTWGMLPVIAITAISGIFFPAQALWSWVQVMAQIFPVSWIGLGMRSAFLPPEAATIEIGGSFRPGLTVLVLGLWAVAGLALAPRVLRRMARRTSGSQVQAARDAALQWVR